jgi:hypothetical protein
MSWHEETLKRLDDLIEHAKGIRWGTDDYFSRFIGWGTQAKSLLESFLDVKNTYISEFTQYATYGKA